MTKRVVSVQDISCLGQCSLTVALPVLSVMGIETVVLPSSVLSTHTGCCFDEFTVHDLTDEMPLIVKHWKKENVHFDGMYTGYIGDARQFEVIDSLRTQLNSGALVIVDPAMGDHGKLYPALGEDIVEGMRKLVAKSDVVLPNITEAALLTGTKYKENYSQEEIETLLNKLCSLGPRYAVITGVSFEKGKLGAGCLDKATGEISYYFNDYVDRIFHGTGDVFASSLVGSMINGKNIHEALEKAIKFTDSCIKATVDDEAHFYGVHFESVLSELIE